MSPPLALPKRTRPREEPNHFARFKHALSALSNGIKHEHSRDKNHVNTSGGIDDHHFCTHSTIHSCISNLKLKFRRFHGPAVSTDPKGFFRFRALDGKKFRSPRLFVSDNGHSDQYVIANAQTVSNDSTDRHLIPMFVRSHLTSIGHSVRRRSSFNTSSCNPTLLSATTACRTLRRYSMADSEVTMASEDLTAREFAEQLGIKVYPEEDDGDCLFGASVSAIAQQHRLQSNCQHSTVLSSTRSTKSKISIMEDTFWTPPMGDLDKSDDDMVPRASLESVDMFARPDSSRERRNSLVTFAETPSMCKYKRQMLSSMATGARPGRHSAPIPIPAPKQILFQQNQQSKQGGTPHSDSLFSVSSESTDSSLTTRSTASSVSTTLTVPLSPPSPTRLDCLETPQIFAIIKNSLSMEPITERPSNTPRIVRKGRFEITIGDLPPPEFSQPRHSTEGEDCSAPQSVASSPADEKYVIFQRRKNRPDSDDDGSDCLHGYMEERRRSLSLSVIDAVL